MGRVFHSIEIPVLASEAEDLWYDLSRWPSFVDGFGKLERQTGEWPQEGATVHWTSPPGGRGRVREHVVRYEPRRGQEVELEDERMRARQTVVFEPGDDEVRVSLELEYELKGRRLMEGMFDTLFVRGPMRESVRRTLARFRREVLTDRELT